VDGVGRHVHEKDRDLPQYLSGDGKALKAAT
jgi:hypothetical protein